jgi:hypothetical protein
MAHAKLSDEHLKHLKKTVTEHIQSLNKAGGPQLDAKNLDAKALNELLGIRFNAQGAADQWLCSCDSHTSCTTH